MNKKKNIIIGLVGLPGAGKTTVSEYLEKKGFKRITLSDFIKIEAGKKGITEFSRDVLQNYGNAMRKEFGPHILAQLALGEIKNLNAQKVVIDGVRNLYEIAYLQVENHFTLVGITADPKVRYQRMCGRTSKSKDKTYTQFLNEEHREESLGSREIGLRVKDCLKRVSYRIKNDKDIPALENQVDKLVQKINTI